MDAYIAAALGDTLAKKLAGNELAKDDALARLRVIQTHDATGVGGVQPENYWYKEVGYFWRVQEFAGSATLDGDDRASTLLVFRREHALACRAPWCDAIAAVRTLLAPATREGRWYRLAATSDAQTGWGAFGFIFTSHGGYHRRELHDDETVYKVSRWHPLQG